MLADKAYRILIRKPQCERLLGRHSNRCGNDKWVQLAQYATPMTVFCEHGNEHSGSIKGEEFLELLSYYQKKTITMKLGV
jgi:hypothetical protein